MSASAMVRTGSPPTPARPASCSRSRPEATAYTQITLRATALFATSAANRIDRRRNAVGMARLRMRAIRV